MGHLGAGCPSSRKAIQVEHAKTALVAAARPLDKDSFDPLSGRAGSLRLHCNHWEVAGGPIGMIVQHLVNSGRGLANSHKAPPFRSPFELVLLQRKSVFDGGHGVMGILCVSSWWGIDVEEWLC